MAPALFGHTFSPLLDIIQASEPSTCRLLNNAVSSSARQQNAPAAVAYRGVVVGGSGVSGTWLARVLSRRFARRCGRSHRNPSVLRLGAACQRKGGRFRLVRSGVHTVSLSPSSLPSVVWNPNLQVFGRGRYRVRVCVHHCDRPHCRNDHSDA